MIIKSFLIENRGRLYFQAKLDGKYPAKVVINDVVSDIEIGQTIALEVRDLSTKSQYGSALKYEPISIKTADDAKQYKLEVEIFRNLEWARQNIRREIFTGVAISFVLSNAMKAKSDECRSAVDAFIAQYEQAQISFKDAKERQRAIIAAGYATEATARSVASSMRQMYAVRDLPYFDVPFRLNDEAVVFTSAGNQFRLNEGSSRFNGKHLRHYEGELGCYCYYRPATEVEIAELVAREAIEAERAKVFKRFSKIATRIKNGERPNDIKGQISGEHIEIGKSETFVISADYIWHLDDYGIKNVGNYGDLCAWRIPYNKKLAAEVKELALKLGLDVRHIVDESAQLKAAISKQIGGLDKNVGKQGSVFAGIIII